MDLRIIVVFLSYSVNPYIRKVAITGLNDYTGYAIIQTTTLMGNVAYLLSERHNLVLDDISMYNIQYSFASSALTILSSYQMTNLIKDKSTANVTTKIQVFTIISSYLVDYLVNSTRLSPKQVFGIILMIMGIAITKT